MKLKQLWCKLIYKHPGRQYATIRQLENAFKNGGTISVEKCLKCGKDIKLYTPQRASTLTKEF